jgi:Mrp family chromosome partitioning ATPase
MIVLICALLFIRSHPLIATAVMCAALVAIAFRVNALIYQKLNIRRVKTTEDVEYLKLTTLAVVPTVSKNHPNWPNDLDPLRSPIAEAYRHLRSSLMMSKSGRPPKTILITASIASEGATTTAVNTAVMMARTGVDVLLIDSDLRRPRLHALFNRSNEKGLSNILAGMPVNAGDDLEGQADTRYSNKDVRELDDKLLERIKPADQTSEARDQKLDRTPGALISSRNFMQPITELPSLWFIPSGPIPPNPAELLGSDVMRALLEVLSERFSHIVLDSPPAGLFTDAVIVSTMVDGVVLVVNADQTPLVEVEKTKTLLTDVGANILGVVLNGVKANENSYYYSGYYELEKDKSVGDVKN